MAPITKRFSSDSPGFRAPRRITITIAWHVQQALQNRADREGRSVSNLAAYELERAMASRPD